MKLPPRAPHRTVGLLLASLLLCAGTSHGADINVMTSGAFTAAYLELKPQFERATQNKAIILATTMGTGPDYIRLGFNAANL
jgi:molybdate transport system substrate-binding protein